MSHDKPPDKLVYTANQIGNFFASRRRARSSLPSKELQPCPPSIAVIESVKSPGMLRPNDRHSRPWPHPRPTERHRFFRSTPMSGNAEHFQRLLPRAKALNRYAIGTACLRAY